MRGEGERERLLLLLSIEGGCLVNKLLLLD